MEQALDAMASLEASLGVSGDFRTGTTEATVGVFWACIPKIARVSDTRIYGRCFMLGCTGLVHSKFCVRHGSQQTTTYNQFFSN